VDNVTVAFPEVFCDKLKATGGAKRIVTIIFLVDLDFPNHYCE
jgi:hypothetical protein